MAASIADIETWHVMIADDDMKRMNVEQLDDAFRLSLVDASTLVWKAGMKTWQRLGAVAGLDDDDDEPDSVTRLRAAPTAPPPPPRPLARPTPKPPSPRQIPPAPRAAPAPRQAVNPFLATAPSPFAATAPSPFAVTAPAFPPPPLVQAPVTRLVAPVYTPPTSAPRRSAMTSEVDFRRGSRGVRWGRWLMLGLVLTGGVLAAYRQNWLRDGARRLGVENKYLYGERRVTAFVSAKAPTVVKDVLGKLALLPGPNAEPVAVTPQPRAPQPVVAVPTTPRSAPPPTAREPGEPEAAPKTESGVKTVSLDSLPVLGESAGSKAEPPTDAAPLARAPVAPSRASTPSEPKARASSARAPVARQAKLETRPKAARRAAVETPPKVEKAKAVAKAQAPVASDNPLKAAIRSAIAADNAK